ncbi:hypothetical protein VTO42DRAFT_6309 [Malbranchea cinnamomea]
MACQPSYRTPLNVMNGRSLLMTQNSSHTSSAPANQRLANAFQSQVHMTPPLTPHSSMEEMVKRNDQTRPIFRSFLRAFYPFQPDAPISSSTVTLPLNQGDVVLVHSVHTNGWADGTLLDTGARGWLPTNYCEPYHPRQMQPLLKALTDFWDIIRNGSLSTLHQFANQDYMKGIVAGVRFLLEQCECLKGDCPLIRQVHDLRRNRRALIAELRSLVNIAKRLHHIASGGELEESLDDIFDLMLLKAFSVVTQGVRFLDVWSEEVGLSGAMADLELHSTVNYHANNGPLTPPVDGSFSSPSALEANPFCKETSTLGAQPSSYPPDPYLTATQPKRLSPQPKRSSVSHRISYNGTSSGVQNSNLVSERLGAAYDGFLGVLGSFIGLHMQSRSSSELILTTQQAVHSCRALLSVVEEVGEHDLHRSEILERSKDAMYETITELVHTVRDIFRPITNDGEEETVFMPEDGKRLVDAATNCVRSAGDCVAKARRVLEQIGDFEMEAVGLGIATSEDHNSTSSNTDNGDDDNNNNNNNTNTHTNANGPEKSNLQIKPGFEQRRSNLAKDSTRSLPPPIQIPSNNMSSLSLAPSLTDGATPSSSYTSTMVQTPTSTLDEPFSSTILSFGELNDPLIPLSDQDATHGFCNSPLVHANPSFQSTLPKSLQCTHNEKTGAAGDSEGKSPFSEPRTPPPPPSKDDVQANSTEESDDPEENLLGKTFAHELMFNKDGQVIGGTLRALVEKLTAHESTPDAMFVSTFYLTFRHFASPTEVAEALIDRFDYVGATPKVAGTVHLRVYNFFKGWLESHWRHDCDDCALPSILKFARTKLMVTIPTAGKRLVDLVAKVSTLEGAVMVPRLVSSMGKTNTSTAQYVSPDVPMPAPILSRSQANLLKQWKAGTQTIGILDFDPMELARQITIKASSIFCSILPEELLGTEWMKKSGSLAVNVRAMSTLSTDLANLVADSILQLEEPKKRALVIKQWIKIASRCLELNNYDSLMAIVCSLNSSTISRLKRTWELVSQKTKGQFEQLREIVDVSRNYAVLRQRIQNHVPPCLPFVGTYLTDLTFVDHGNQNTRNLPVVDGSLEVINFDKHMKTAKIISELQRFQIPYRLTEVPELQAWIQDQLVRVRSAGEKSFQAYYRRSLVLEPREQSTRGSPSEPSTFSLENAKDKFDFLSWTHVSRNKHVG